MPFEILTEATIVTNPTDISLVGAEGFKVQAQANLDAAGGALTIDAATSSLIYTDADGASVSVDVTLPDNAILYDGEGAVFGSGLNKFLVPVGEVDENQFNAYFGLIEVTIDESGTPILSELMDLETGPDLYAAFEVYPLGDGRVGYALGSSGGDSTGITGVFEDAPDAIERTLEQGGNTPDGETYYIATPDGGTIAISRDFGETDVYSITQFAPDGTQLVTEIVTPDAISDVEGREFFDATFLINENGELDGYYTFSTEPDADETFRVQYDLLPLVDLVIEPPLPPVNEDDVLDVFASETEVFGFGGNDTIDSAGPLNTIFGGDGDDTIIVGGPGSTIFGDAGNDDIESIGPKSTLFGGEGDDSLRGVGPESTLFGDAGNDIIDVVFSDSTVFGGDGDDDITAANLIYGGNGDDTVTVTSIGSSVFGGAGEDAITGGGGNDFIRGGDGNDVADMFLDGGLNGGGGDDTIYGGDGIDFIDGGAGNDDLRGGRGDDDAFVPDGDGGVSDNEGGMFGGAGDDFMRGNAGFDFMWGDEGNDDMNGGHDTDDMYGGDGNDKMAGYDGDDFLSGDDGNDVMHGGRGDDDVRGDAGDDTIRGAQGDDYLEGDEGDDLLIGGEGADQFAYSLDGDNGTDMIKDFTQGEDTIRMRSGDTELTFDDIFLSQDDSIAIIEIGDTTIQLKGVTAEELTEDDIIFL